MPNFWKSGYWFAGHWLAGYWKAVLTPADYINARRRVIAPDREAFYTAGRAVVSKPPRESIGSGDGRRVTAA